MCGDTFLIATFWLQRDVAHAGPEGGLRSVIPRLEMLRLVMRMWSKSTLRSAPMPRSGARSDGGILTGVRRVKQTGIVHQSRRWNPELF